MTRPAYLREVCWDDEDVLCLQNEASSPAQADDPYRGKHVFDAIHTPPPLFHHTDVRRFVSDTGGGSETGAAGRRAPIDQQRLLDAVDEGRGAGRNLLFIAGATGAGKSHMVRWLHAQYSERNRSTLCIHVRRRDTDLVTVVRRLATAFGDRDGAALQKLVTDAEAAGGATTANFLNTTLVSALSAYAREVAEHSVRYSSSVLTPKQAALRRDAGFTDAEAAPQPGHIEVVVAQEQIALARAWADLVRTQPAETALEAGLLLKMKASDPAQRQVVGDDLSPLALLSDQELAPNLRPLRDRLSDPLIRDWIADVLLGPRAMDFAVQASGAAIQAEALQNALRDALESAADAGKRMVFFFEDWGSVTGVRSGLLEAFTSMDDIHTAVIADTTRELRKLQDNVADRSVAVFELGQVSDQFGLQLAARALNAVRVGGSALYDGARASRQVVNACADCPYIRECHRTFGSVEDDQLGAVGLFPLTHSTIERALSRDGMQRTPRGMIMDILRRAIDQSTGLFSRSQYPTHEIAAALAPDEFRLDDAARQEIAATVDSERTKTASAVLHLYRDQLALRSLAPELSQAFELSDFGAEQHTKTACPRCQQTSCRCRDLGTGEDEDDSTQRPPPRPQIPQLAKDAERYGRGEARQLGSRLRDTMFEYAVAGVGYGNGIATRSELDDQKRLRSHHFGLEDTQGQHLAQATPAQSAALRALAWASETTPPGSWRVQDTGHRRRASALNIVATWTQQVDSRLRDPALRAQRAGTLLPFLVALNALVTPDTPIDTPADLLNLALSEATPEFGVTNSVHLQNALHHRVRAREAFLSDVCLVQGDGSPFGVDTTIIYDVLAAEHRSGVLLPTANSLPGDLQPWGKAVARSLDEARSELEGTLARLAGLRQPVEDEELLELAQSAKAVRNAIADLPDRVSAAELQVLKLLERQLEAAENTQLPPEDPALPRLDDLQVIELPSALREARQVLATFLPRVEVAVQAERLIDSLGTRVEIPILTDHAVVAQVNEIATRTRRNWPTPTVVPGTGPTMHVGTSASNVGARLRALVHALRNQGQVLEWRRTLDEASERAEAVISLLTRQEQLREQQHSLRLSQSSFCSPPSPVGADPIGHLRGGAITDWISQALQEVAEHQANLRVEWSRLRADYHPTNYWKIARLLGDDEAEAAFDEADALFDSLGDQVPDDAFARLEEVKNAEGRAWASLRSHRAGPALDLAVRIQENGGRLALTDIDESAIVPLLGPEVTGTLEFEIRLVET